MPESQHAHMLPVHGCGKWFCIRPWPYNRWRPGKPGSSASSMMGIARKLLQAENGIQIDGLATTPHAWGPLCGYVQMPYNASVSAGAARLTRPAIYGRMSSSTCPEGFGGLTNLCSTSHPRTQELCELPVCSSMDGREQARNQRYAVIYKEHCGLKACDRP
jgi:hypothetical protein